MRNAFALAIVLSIPCAPLFAGNTFNVRDFGAIGDGTSYDTAAIQKALDACNGTGGMVEFPAGTYLSRPLTVHTKTTVHLDKGATLVASPIQSDYLKGGGDWLKVKGGGAFTPFLSGSQLEDVTLEGPGTIEGHGEVWWPEAGKARQITPGYTLPRPNLIVLSHAKNLVVRDITIQNSPKFHLVPTDADGVVISNVTILAPVTAANTDAIDPSDSRNVLITHCTIDTGDDNVAIKAGHKPADGGFACENYWISDCTFKHGHGMSIGSETGGAVRNVVVTNCTFENTDNGLRIKSQQGKGGLVEDIHYIHLTMKNVDPAVTFSSYYQNNSAKDARQPAADGQALEAPARKGTPMYRDIYITDVNATCERGAGLIYGTPQCCISNVVFDHVTITAATGFKIYNARDIQFKDTVVTPAKGKACLLGNSTVEGVSADQEQILQ